MTYDTDEQFAAVVEAVTACIGKGHSKVRDLADWDDVIDHLRAKHSVSEDAAKAWMDVALDGGKIYEPILSLVKVA
jgi:hypothetical protein